VNHAPVKPKRDAIATVATIIIIATPSKINVIIASRLRLCIELRKCQAAKHALADKSTLHDKSRKMFRGNRVFKIESNGLMDIPKFRIIKTAAAISEVTTTGNRRLVIPPIRKRLESQLELIDARSPVTIMVRLIMTLSWTTSPRTNTGREPRILITRVRMKTAKQRKILLKYTPN
jgi:hypothetical protein